MRVLSASRKGGRDGRGSGRQSREVWEREDDGRPYLGEKRWASDGRPRRSDIFASRVTATKLQICRWFCVVLWVFLGEETTKRRGKVSVGRGCSCRNEGPRGTSSRGEGGCTRDAPTASCGFLLSSPRLSVLLLPAVARWKEITPAVSLNSLLFFSSTHLKNYETRPKSQTAQNIN